MTAKEKAMLLLDAIGEPVWIKYKGIERWDILIGFEVGEGCKLTYHLLSGFKPSETECSLFSKKPENKK